ncbi:unnamed protein product (macronuclear) [Paramecium tetraurelia]|uniref:Uncharacterized protein n=1 Tax=Paramecium tetraurelia TaxID=5888 RepID=A0E6C3_PARTE|nr:uncharacterized protein GSPATT00003705001 [Paramecium tetraurelia]CAK90840.1 unnamed protein product [Paramecium tetraurelia]|eukprot:XP_001458237.1 hypothetical protein (macronuclear) [Paramecium tetraurelia strain d4-2]
MHVQYEENEKRSLICRGCAGRTLGQDSSKCCCQENKFVNVLKNHYVDGKNINQLKEMLDLTQGCENFCEEHGYLYEFIMTKKLLSEGESQFDSQELYCKMCIKQNQEKLQSYNIELLNDQYCIMPEQNSQMNQNGQQQNDQSQAKSHSEQLRYEVNNVFEKMRIASQNEQQLKEKIVMAYQRKENIKYQVRSLSNINQQNQVNQLSKEDQENRDKMISQLQKLKDAIDLRIKAIAYLENGYHDYLHDDYLEGESVRTKIINEGYTIQVDEYGNHQEKGGELNTAKGYSIVDAIAYFDHIQLI